MFSFWSRSPVRVSFREAPLVEPLPPDPSLSNSHHGPPPSAGYFTGAADEAEGSRPRYFQNPWPSYRTASLGDAYRAYQLGAAIAHPQFKELEIKRSESNSLNGEDGEEGEDLVQTPQLPKEHYKPHSKVYVRPDFASMYEDDDEEDWRDPPVKVVPPIWGKGDKPAVTWLGHAGALVQLPWTRRSVAKESGRRGMCGVLFDPIFSYRCSPSQYVGPARYMEAPCSVSELPEIHVCCISHDHYDHLDYHTIMDLWKHHKNTIHFFVPLGLKPWFEASTIPTERVTELDWWNESIVSFPSLSGDYDSQAEEPANGDLGETDLALKIALTPAQHRSGRGILDHMTTLWGSWCVGVIDPRDRPKARERGMSDWEGFKVYFGGDTGYRYATAPEGDPDAICPAFQDHYGPISLSLLPLSTGSSLPFLRNLLMLSLDQYTLTSSLHCSPSDSLEIHRILQSERSLGIHWGTFCDASEARGTRVEFGRARRERGVAGSWDGLSSIANGEEGVHDSKRSMDEDLEGKKGRFVVAEIGETLTVP